MNTTHTMKTKTKVTPAMRRVLRAIEQGTPWRASEDTVQAILDAGLAHYDDNCVWHLTTKGPTS